jgi:hypothetical protein
MPSGKVTHSDFLIHVSRRPAFYMECTVAQLRDHRTDERLHRLYDDLTRLRSPNFLLDVRPMGDIPKGNPPIKRIRREVGRWLNSLDPDGVTAQVRLHGYRGFPTLLICVGGWHVEFEAVPRKARTSR